MAKFDDFDLDVVQVSKQQAEVDPRWKSEYLCTPGCVTGILQTCIFQTATCNCQISK